MLRTGVSIAIDGHGRDAETAQGAQDPDRDLTAIRHEHAIEHGHIRKTP